MLQAHCHFYVLKTFAASIQQAEAGADVVRVLQQLCLLYATYGVTTNSGQFLEVCHMLTYIASWSGLLSLGCVCALTVSRRSCNEVWLGSSRERTLREGQTQFCY